MNDRIDQLAKQCWSHRVDGTLVDGQLHFDTKKFAELIVKECANVAADHDALDIYEEIREHFGVGE